MITRCSNDYARMPCPEAVAMCQESFWISHELMLADPADLDDFAAALEKIAANASDLAHFSKEKLTHC